MLHKRKYKIEWRHENVCIVLGEKRIELLTKDLKDFRFTTKLYALKRKCIYCM